MKLLDYGKFKSIAFVVVKVFKGFCTYSASMHGPFWEVLGLFLRQIRLDFTSVFRRGIPSLEKKVFDEFFKILSFYSKGNILKGTHPKTHNFGPFLGPRYPRKIRTIGKNQNFFKNCIFRTMK